MSYTYAQRRRAGGAPAQAPAAESPARMDALRSGAVKPTAAEMGHRVDLPQQMRSRMESSFGADLSAVKLYESRTVADAGAEAVTQGNNIAFAPGKLDFASRGGQELLGHELSHVVSQQRGEVTGGGFLNDHALEARADREGARAAAGEQVYGGAVAPLSGASAVSAAGPMQARKEDKDNDRDFKAKKLLTENDGPSAEEQERNQAYVDMFGSELEQDTGWNMDASVKKKGFWERNVGKYFHKNDSVKNVAKNIGIGAGLAIGAVPLALFKGIKAGAGKLGGYLKRSNQEAVDYYNNYGDDYKQMSRWERFKSAVANPIAWATANRRKKGTQERNERRAKINAAATLWRKTNAGRIEDSDASFDALREIPQAQGTGNTDPGDTQDDPDALGKASLVATGGKFAEKYAPMLGGEESVAGIQDLGGDLSGMSGLHRGFGAASSGFGALSGALGTAKNIVSAQNQARAGDNAGAASAGMEALGTLATTGSGVMQGVSYGTGLANAGVASAIPGLDIATGAMNALSGATQAIRGSLTRSNMTESMKELDEKGELTRDQQRMRKAFQQAHGVAKADQAEGIMKTIGGAMQAGGGAATLTGVGGLLGTGLSVGGIAVNFAGGVVGDKMRDSAGNDSLEEEVDFDKQKEIVKRRFKNLKLSDREAEDLVLQSMGTFSGDRKEAVQRMTMKRAFSLTNAANNSTDENHEIAEKGLSGMGLSKVDGKFSLQGAAQKLGFAKNKNWREQMLETRKQGAYFNPFKEKVKKKKPVTVPAGAMA